jgi:hypothetical protein
VIARLLVLLALALGLASCASLPFGDAGTGVACTHPPPLGEERTGDPVAPGQPLEGMDPTTMGAAEVAAEAMAEGLEVTYRYSYGVGDNPAEGYSECWCIPPPDGSVSGLAYDTAGRLVIFVDSDERLPAARPQPRLGWGC